MLSVKKNDIKVFITFAIRLFNINFRNVPLCYTYMVSKYLLTDIVKRICPSMSEIYLFITYIISIVKLT